MLPCHSIMNIVCDFRSSDVFGRCVDQNGSLSIPVEFAPEVRFMHSGESGAAGGVGHCGRFYGTKAFPRVRCSSNCVYRLTQLIFNYRNFKL